MGSGLELRVATPKDAEIVARFINAAYHVERFFVDGDRTSPEEVRKLLETGSFLRAELPPFYRALGYTETGTAPFPAPSRLPSRCILMSKALEPHAPEDRFVAIEVVPCGASGTLLRTTARSKPGNTKVLGSEWLGVLPGIQVALDRGGGT